LTELHEGDISRVISTDNFLQVVKVTSRRPARYTPFENIQDKLRKVDGTSRGSKVTACQAPPIAKQEPDKATSK
jgi:hypothetical protein